MSRPLLQNKGKPTLDKSIMGNDNGPKTNFETWYDHFVRKQQKSSQFHNP